MNNAEWAINNKPDIRADGAGNRDEVRRRNQGAVGGGGMSEKHYRCIKSFGLPKCDDDGIESEDGEWLTVEVGDTFYRSEVTWMSDVRLESVGRTWYWLEINEQTFAEHFVEVEE